MNWDDEDTVVGAGLTAIAIVGIQVRVVVAIVIIKQAI
jgi:hypothetical protein